MTDLNDSLAEKLLGFTPRESNGSGITWWWCDPTQCSIDDESTPHVQLLDFSGSWEGMKLVVDAMKDRGWKWTLDESSFGPAGDQDHTHHGRLWNAALEPFSDDDDRYIVEISDTLPMAVALAAQSALGAGE